MVHGVDNVGTVPAALTAYLALQVRVQFPCWQYCLAVEKDSPVCPSSPFPSAGNFSAGCPVWLTVDRTQRRRHSPYNSCFADYVKLAALCGSP